MPQQYPSRATLHLSRTSRRVRVLRTVGASVAAAALTATPLPEAFPAAPAVVSSDVASPVAPADDAVAAAMILASGALAHAEHVAAEAPHPEAVAEIVETTFVVRELVRRASSGAASSGAASSGTAASDAAALPAATADDAADAASGTTGATGTPEAATATADSADSADSAEPAPSVTPAVSDAADAAVAAAADAAGLAGEGLPADDRGAIAAALEQQATVLSELLATTPVATVDVTPAPSAEEIAAEQAAQLAAQLAALAAEAAQYANGQIPAHLLSELPWSPGSVLRADAAHQLALLNEAFAAHFGRDLAITDSYRSYDDQVAVKRARGRWAAQPGTSNHGYGVAVDLGGGIASFGSAEYEWMRAHAGEFGWENPAWAQRGGSKPEAWHWEYVG